MILGNLNQIYIPITNFLVRNCWTFFPSELHLAKLGASKYRQINIDKKYNESIITAKYIVYFVFFSLKKKNYTKFSFTNNIIWKNYSKSLHVHLVQCTYSCIYVCIASEPAHLLEFLLSKKLKRSYSTIDYCHEQIYNSPELAR